MEKEEEKYIKLFTPLQREQEDMVYNIWKENIFEDIYHREIAIKKYCKEVNCDFLMALYSIIKIIKNRYLMSLSNGEIAYPSKSLVEKLILEKEVYKREEYGHLEIIDQKMCELNEKGYLDYPYIHIKLTQKDVNDLKNACEALIKERLKNIQPYIDNPLNAPCIIENYDILPQIERQFYYQIEKIKQDETTDKFDNKHEVDFDKDTKSISNNRLEQISDDSKDLDEDNFTCYKILDSIVKDRLVIQKIKKYIYRMLDKEYNYDLINDEIEFFKKEIVASICEDYLDKPKKSYTDSQLGKIGEISNYLEITLSYKKTQKEITYDFINKASKKKCNQDILFTILALDNNLEVDKLEKAKKKFIELHKYNNIIEDSKLFDRFTNQDIKKQNKNIIDCSLKELNIERSSIKEYEKQKEKLIYEIILLINNVIKQGYSEEETIKPDNKKEIVYDKQEKNIDEKEEEIKEEDENKEYYVSISKRLNQFIKRGTPENYSDIVNEKSFSNKKKYLIINRRFKKDCVLFAKVFNLTKDSLVAILKQKDGKNCKEIELTNQYFNSIEINLANPTEYEKALIKVRNECLNKINPSDFPILERKHKEKL